MTRVLNTHQRSTRQAVRKHRADFINARPKMYNRMTAAEVWEGLHRELGDAVLTVRDFGAIWRKGMMP